MANKRAKGLYKRGSTWHIDRMVHGERIRESTGESDFDRAFEVMVRRINQEKDGHVAGKRPQHTFEKCYYRYLDETTGAGIVYRKLGIQLLPALGHLPIEDIDANTVREFLDGFRAKGRKANTLRLYRDFVCMILRRAATTWFNPNGTTWLARTPDIPAIHISDQLLPYPITWLEEELLLSRMSEIQRDIVLFTLNTGLRDCEVRSLSWDWEYSIPEVGENVFRIPSCMAKNGQSRLVVLNSLAREIVERNRGKHPHSVFVSKYGSPFRWPLVACFFRRHRNWASADYEGVIGTPCPDGFRTMRFHDLRHTFGHRLLAADVSLEVRALLLGHALPHEFRRQGAITVHYSAADYLRLRDSVERICDRNFRNTPTVPILRLIKRTAD